MTNATIGFFAVLLLAGCSDPTGPLELEPVSVQGVLTENGLPLVSARVRIVDGLNLWEDPSCFSCAEGFTDVNGRFYVEGEYEREHCWALMLSIWSDPWPYDPESYRKKHLWQPVGGCGSHEFNQDFTSSP